MRRMILVLTVSAMMLMTVLTGVAVGDIGDPDAGHKGYGDDPGTPECEWYGPFGYGNDAWWEYWCWWPGWGWEYVFWVWA